MKVLYIGVYKDGTGWGHAAQENILALDAAGVEVVPRALKLNNIDAEIPERIKELESNSPKDCDIVIQNILPHHFEYDGKYHKNIGVYFSETSDFKTSSWPERINLMDSAWVSCRDSLNASIKSLVKTPIHVVPVPTDISKFQKKYTPIEALQEPTAGKFMFYTIGEINRRKNIVAMLKAFHLEFSPDEDVGFLIKGTIPGVSPKQTDDKVAEICNTVKEQLKLYSKKTMYHSEIIITQRLKEEELMRLHNTCDCYVSSSFGEGWNIPAFEAMAFGKTPILTNQGGHKEFLGANEKELGGWLVNGYDDPVFGMIDTFHDLFVGSETWKSIDILSLRKAMREAYENEQLRKKKSEYGINYAYNFSHEVIGNQMRNILENE